MPDENLLNAADLIDWEGWWPGPALKVKNQTPYRRQTGECAVTAITRKAAGHYCEAGNKLAAYLGISPFAIPEWNDSQNLIYGGLVVTIQMRKAAYS